MEIVVMCNNCLFFFFWPNNLTIWQFVTIVAIRENLWPRHNSIVQINQKPNWLGTWFEKYCQVLWRNTVGHVREIHLRHNSIVEINQKPNWLGSNFAISLNWCSQQFEIGINTLYIRQILLSTFIVFLKSDAGSTKQKVAQFKIILC